MAGSMSVGRGFSYRLDHGYQYVDSHPEYTELVKSYPDTTFIFEYVFPDDIHVVRYDEEDYGLHLVGARDVKTGHQWNYFDIITEAELHGIRHAEIINSSLDDVLGSLDSKKKWSEAEGVVMNMDGFLLKIKYNDYVKYNRRLNDLYTPNGVLKAYSAGYLDDLLPKLPENRREAVLDYCKKIDDFTSTIKNEIDSEYSRLMIHNPTSKKDAML